MPAGREAPRSPQVPGTCCLAPLRKPTSVRHSRTIIAETPLIPGSAPHRRRRVDTPNRGQFSTVGGSNVSKVRTPTVVREALPGTTMPAGREAPRSPQVPGICCLAPLRKPTNARELLVGASGLRQVPGSCWLAPLDCGKCLAVAGDQCGFEAPVTRVVASDGRRVGARVPGARMRAGRGAPRSPQVPGSRWLAPPETDKVRGSCWLAPPETDKVRGSCCLAPLETGKCPAVAGWRLRRPTSARQLRAIIADSRDPRTAASGATARLR
jgi:hypothetical protein